MCVRLAFSIAIHTETDILLIDEVLSVADSSYQQKCLRKIFEKSDRERTTLIVSHDLTFIRTFCTRVLVLDHGRILHDGPTTRVAECLSRSLETPEYSALQTT